MDQGLQIAGAVLILIAFIGAQLGRLPVHSYTYLALNVIGSLLLALLAWLDRQWGFFLLETVWTIVSLWSIAARLRERSVR